MNLIMKLKKRAAFTLTELVVTTAVMGTLAAVAVPKFSDVNESAKENKTMANIDNIIQGALNFYNEKVTAEGRGRFPNQSAFNVAIDATSEKEIFSKIVVDNIETNEWFEIFGESIKSPYGDDKSYMYSVVAGTGQGESAAAPVLTVWDSEDPTILTKTLQP